MVTYSLYFGSACAIIGVVLLLAMDIEAMQNKSFLFALVAGVAGFIAGTFAWWFLIEKKNTFTIARCVCVGVISNVLAHYLCWYCLVIIANIYHVLLGEQVVFFGSPPVNLIEGLWLSATLSLFSLFYVGWITIPSGCLISCGLGFFRRRGEQSSPQVD